MRGKPLSNINTLKDICMSRKIMCMFFIHLFRMIFHTRGFSLAQRHIMPVIRVVTPKFTMAWRAKKPVRICVLATYTACVFFRLVRLAVKPIFLGRVPVFIHLPLTLSCSGFLAFFIGAISVSVMRRLEPFFTP